MTYATTQHFGALHFERILPLDARIVEIQITSKIKNYRHPHSDLVLTLYSSLLLAGTKKYSKTEIDTFLKKHGIKLGISALGGCINFSITTRSTNVAHALTLLDQIIYEPSIPPTEFKNKMQVMQEENREARDNAMLIAEINFRNILYPQSSFMSSQTLDDQEHELKTITRRKITAVTHDLIFGEWFVSIVGDQKTEKTLSSFLTKLSLNASVTPRNEHSAKILESSAQYHTIPGKTNVELRIGNILPITPQDDDYVPFIFGLAVLGKIGGFSGRLMSTVREKEGLTYRIYANTVESHVMNTGYWHIFTFFTGKDLKRGLAAVRREITLLIKDGITKRELSVFKEIFENQFLIAHESNRRRARLYHTAIVHGESPEDLERTMKKISLVTVEMVNDSLRKYIIPKKLIISGAGPVRKDGSGIVSQSTE